MIFYWSLEGNHHLAVHCDIQDEQVDSFVSKCEQFKEDLFNEFIKNVLDEINKLTGEREIQEDYERICKEVTKEYLIDLLNKNRTESLVIKLCVKLEAKLKHRPQNEIHYKNQRMHLTVNQVKELLPILQRFVETGEISEVEND